MYACCSVLITIVTYVLVLTSATLHVIMYMFVAFEVRGTQPLICVGCSVHYWVTCAINKGGFFEISFLFVVVVDTHLPRFEVLA